jgi:hypothetical protein
MRISAKKLAQTGSAARAWATRGRKTRFESVAEVEERLSRADADAEIEEGMEEWKARRKEGLAR